jgi:hypothetical protein
VNQSRCLFTNTHGQYRIRRLLSGFMIGEPVTSADLIDNFQEQITVNVVSENAGGAGNS